MIWVVPIQTVCRATIVIRSHITTVPGGITRVITAVPGGITRVITTVPEGKTRVITTVPGGITRVITTVPEGKTRVITTVPGRGHTRRLSLVPRPQSSGSIVSSRHA